MSLAERFNKWFDEKRQWRDWIAYRLTHPVSDWVAQNTDYEANLRSANVKMSTRLYVSITVLYGLMIWIGITIASNAVLIPIEWLTAIVSVAQAVLEFTNVALFLQGVGQGFIDSLQALVKASSQVSFKAIFQGIESTLRGIGRSIKFIGAILLAIATVFDTVVEPVLSILGEVFGQIDISASPTEQGALGDIISSFVEALPSRQMIRNVLSIIAAPLAGLGFIGAKLYWPIYVSNERARDIENGLARSYTFMYALAEGGLDVYEVMREMADAEDAYGEVAVTFRKIVRNANKGEESLGSAMVEIAEETPSEELEEFLNGLVNAIDTGSDVTRYIETQAERALREARDAQENRLNLYELISETYVILFVAAPIFFLILQLVQAMTGGLNKGAAQFVPYALIPVGGFMIGAVVYFTGSKGSIEFKKLEATKTSKWYDIEEHTETDPEFQALSHRFSESLGTLKRILLAPILRVKYNPKLSLVITVPIAILFVAGAIQAGIIPTSGVSAEEVSQVEGVDSPLTLGERIDKNATEFTIVTMYIPAMIILVPWSLLYEAKRRKQEKVVKQLPQMFNSIAEANKRGLTLQESLEATAKTSNSSLYNELQRSIRKSKFTSDINGSLIDFANAVRVPRLSQSVRLLVKANEVSSNVTVVVEAIAEDLESYYELKTDRKQRVRVYVVIMFMAFLISAGVLIALDVTFFGFISEQVSGSNGSKVAARQGASYGQNLPIDFFRRVFIHTLFMLALVSGLVAGMMENGDPQNGFKYAIAMVTLGLFGFIAAPLFF